MHYRDFLAAQCGGPCMGFPVHLQHRPAPSYREPFLTFNPQCRQHEEGVAWLGSGMQSWGPAARPTLSPAGTPHRSCCL